MRPRIARTLSLCLVAATTAVAQVPTPSSAVFPTPQAPHVGETKPTSKLTALLASWEAASRKVETLMVVFERTDRSTKWGDQVYQGQAFFKRPGLACLEFKKAATDDRGKPKFKADAKGVQVMDVEKEPFQRIVCTGKEVLQYEWDEQAVYIYPVDREKLQKGWFARLHTEFVEAILQIPYCYQVDSAALQRRFEVRLIADEKEIAILELTGRAAADKEMFGPAIVFLDKRTMFPTKVILHPAGGRTSQEFRFTAIQPNKPIDDAFFHPPTEIPSWKTVQIPANWLK